MEDALAALAVARYRDPQPHRRIVADHGGDLGVVELGLSSIFAVGSCVWCDGLLRIEMQFEF